MTLLFFNFLKIEIVFFPQGIYDNLDDSYVLFTSENLLFEFFTFWYCWAYFTTNFSFSFKRELFRFVFKEDTCKYLKS